MLTRLLGFAQADHHLRLQSRAGLVGYRVGWDGCQWQAHYPRGLARKHARWYLGLRRTYHPAPFPSSGHRLADIFARICV